MNWTTQGSKILNSAGEVIAICIDETNAKELVVAANKQENVNKQKNENFDVLVGPQW